MSKSRWVAYAVVCLIGLVFGWAAVECHLDNRLLFGAQTIDAWARIFGVFAALFVAVGVASSLEYCWGCRLTGAFMTVATLAFQVVVTYVLFREGRAVYASVMLFCGLLLFSLVVAFINDLQGSHARGEHPHSPFVKS